MATRTGGESRRAMVVLFLGPAESALLQRLRAFGEETVAVDEPLTQAPAGDFVVSYGYRYLLPASFLRRFGSRAINLHISYLPWNRGADPNLWSFIEGTPKGVSIHQLDSGIDTGAILAQERVTFGPGETLRSSYGLLQRRILELFERTWEEIRSERIAARPQSGAGTFHRTRDRERIAPALTQGWDTPVEALERYGLDHGLRLTPSP